MFCIFAGDTINVSYTITDGYTEGNSRAYVMLDGRIVAAGKTQGAFDFIVPEDAAGKELTVTIIPAVGTFYGNTEHVISFGTVNKISLTAQQSGSGISWSYDAEKDTEDSIVIVALYDEMGMMVKCEIVNIASGQTYQNTLTDDTAVKGKVFRWESQKSAKPLQKNLTVTILK